MKTFVDDRGRTWAVHITCGSLKRIAAHAGFDIADISNGKAVDLFGGNTTHLLDILWPCVKATAERDGVTYDEFGDGLRGEALSSATAVLKEELLDFFPPSRRALMAKLLARMDKIVGEALQKAAEDIDTVQLPSVTGGTLHTSAQESLESAPTTGP